MRTLVFLICLAAGMGLLVWAAGGIEGPRSGRPDPRVERAAEPAPGTALSLGRAREGASGLRLDDLEGPRYAMPEARVFRDPATGERIEIPHFLPWAFAARAGRALPAASAPGNAIQFEDVVVRTYREPETLAEARRLRDDPRAIDDFVRLELLARRARADGIAGTLGTDRHGAPAGTDVVILLDGDVRVHDRTLGVLARSASVAFDPRTQRAAGTGPFTVTHPAWSLEGEDFVLTRGPGSGDERRSQAFRFEVSRRAFLSVNENVLDPQGRPVWDDPAAFRPARVFAGRATIAHGDTGPASPLKIVLEDGVRALQQGGRRLDGDRLSLSLEPRGPERRGWELAHLVAEGNPMTIEVPDLEGASGPAGAVRISAQRLRHEPSALGPPTTVLEGSPVVLFEGDLSVAGHGGLGRWLRASATERAVLAPAPSVGRAMDGSPLAGRRIELRGSARLERRGEDGSTPFEDVLEGDEITLVLRSAEKAGRETPVSFAALGRVRLSGTRLEGLAERLVAEGLDTLAPRLVIEGAGTRLALVGFDQGQRLYGPERAGPLPADAAPRAAQRGWTIDRVEAVGAVRGTTSLGGPAVGVPTWLEAERVDYDRVTDRVALLGQAGTPAGVWVEAAQGVRHSLTAPRLTFERERARIAADGGVHAEVYLGGGATPGGLPNARTAPGRLKTLALTTDGRIEVRLTLASVGGEPALDVAQSLEVQAPFEAQILAQGPGAVDRLSAERLAISFALREQPAETRVAGLPLARPATPTSRGGSTDLRTPGGAARLSRWSLESRSLVLTLADGQRGTFDADGGTVLGGEGLGLQAERLRFSRRVGMLTLDGGAHPVAARLGPPETESRLTARTVQISLDEQGPRWIGATGPIQAVLLQRSPTEPGRVERYELDCAGDVRLAPEEISALGPTWVRRTLRVAAGAAWTESSEIWADHVTVHGKDLLTTGGGAAAVQRNVRTVVAEGPKTTLRTGEAERRVEIWCRRIEVDVPTDRAVLSGLPGEAVVVHIEGRSDIEIARAAFDFRTGDVQDLEAGRAILRRGR